MVLSQTPGPREHSHIIPAHRAVCVCVICMCPFVFAPTRYEMYSYQISDDAYSHKYSQSLYLSDRFFELYFFLAASTVNRTYNRRTNVAAFNEITSLIKQNDFNSIWQYFKRFNSRQWYRFLNISRDECTLFVLAIKTRKFKVAHFLLGFSVTYGNRHPSEIWNKSNHHHPLKAAFGVSHRPLIKEIVDSLWDINQCSYGSNTPLMLAIHFGDIEYVMLLIELGADINLPNRHTGCTPLMVSVIDAEICWVLSKHNVNLDCRDKEGNTALHKAIIERCDDSVKVLIKAGVNVHIKNNEGLSPLMLAALSINDPIVNYLESHVVYSDLDIIEAMELLNASLVLKELDNIEYWTRALELRRCTHPRNSPYLPQKILDYSQKFFTRNELETLRGKPLHLAFQGILVIERFLGRNGSVYLQSFLLTALIAKHVRNLEKLRELINYIQELCEVESPKVVAYRSSLFEDLFNEFLNDDDPESLFENGGFSIFKMISQAIERMGLLIKEYLSADALLICSPYSRLLELFLYMTLKIVDLNPSRQYLSQFYECVVKLVRKDPRDEHHKSMLHCAISLVLTKRWATIKLIRVLLESGVNVDSKDYLRRTPIFYAVKHGHTDKAQEIIEVLLEYNAHLDCQSSEGFTIMDYPCWTSLPIRRNPRSLQCHAVEVILDNGIDYKGQVNVIRDFINFHK